MIYIDLKEAIHFIIRQLSIGGSISDALLAKVCARFGLPVDVLHDLHHHLGGPIMSSWQLERSMLTRSFKFVDKEITELGTRPGDCIADIIFSCLWCTILKLLQCELQRHDPGGAQASGMRCQRQTSSHIPSFFGANVDG